MKHYALSSAPGVFTAVTTANVTLEQTPPGLTNIPMVGFNGSQFRSERQATQRGVTPVARGKA
jgi:hypothetical protein